MSVLVTLVRHGQTTMNLEKKIQTRTDALLSELGVLQAEALGKQLQDEGFTRLYCSDKKRTINTAEHILKYNKNPIPDLVQDERLRERVFFLTRLNNATNEIVEDFGDWEDESVTLIHDQAMTLGIRMHKLSPPGGESYENFAEKGHQFFMDICRLAGSENGGKEENILIVSHGGWILTLLDNLINNADKYKVENLVVDETIRTPLNTSATKMLIKQRPGTGNEDKYSVQFLSVFDARHLETINGVNQNQPKP